MDQDSWSRVASSLTPRERGRLRLVCAGLAATFGAPSAWTDVPQAVRLSNFESACTLRSVASAAKLIGMFGLDRMAETAKSRCFVARCLIGSAAAARGIAAALGIDASRLALADKRTAFTNMCYDAPLDDLLSLLDLVGLARADLRFRAEAAWSAVRPLRAACSRGRLALARWLAEEFAIPTEHVRRAGNATLYAACCSGHLETVEWLIRNYGLEFGDVYGSVFVAVCERGHLAVAQWLHSTFDVTRAVHYKDNDAVYQACKENRLEVVMWLVQEFDLTVEKLREFEAPDSGRPRLSEVLQRNNETTRWLELALGAGALEPQDDEVL